MDEKQPIRNEFYMQRETREAAQKFIAADNIHREIEEVIEEDADELMRLAPPELRPALDTVRQTVIKEGATRQLAETVETLSGRPVVQEEGIAIESFTKMPSKTNQKQLVGLLGHLVSNEGFIDILKSMFGKRYQLVKDTDFDLSFMIKNDRTLTFLNKGKMNYPILDIQTTRNLMKLHNENMVHYVAWATALHKYWLSIEADIRAYKKSSRYNPSDDTIGELLQGCKVTWVDGVDSAITAGHREVEIGKNIKSIDELAEPLYTQEQYFISNKTVDLPLISVEERDAFIQEVSDFVNHHKKNYDTISKAVDLGRKIVDEFGTAKDDLDFAGEEENVFLLFFMVTGFGPVVINNPYFLAINKYHELTAAKTA